MTRFRHDLILRMIKLLDAVLVTIPFAMCWGKMSIVMSQI